jgi:hypothetical protein
MRHLGKQVIGSARPLSLILPNIQKDRFDKKMFFGDAFSGFLPEG